jgi:hypothetical protein
LVFASGGFGPAAVSRFDAELLFRLKDASLGHDNALDWQALFVDGVANYLKGFALKNAQLSHERLKELEDFIADNRASVGRFFGRMARSIPETANHLGVVFGKKSRLSYAEQAAAGAEVTSDEQKWLDAMIDADGQIDPFEQALLQRIAEDD